MQKYTEGEWLEVPMSDRFKLTKPTGQVWLALYTLLMDDECRRKYQWSTFNKNELLRLRGFFNDVVSTQNRCLLKQSSRKGRGGGTLSLALSKNQPHVRACVRACFYFVFLMLTFA